MSDVGPQEPVRLRTRCQLKADLFILSVLDNQETIETTHSAVYKADRSITEPHFCM